MGARTVWKIKTSEEHAIHLYSHWQGEHKIRLTQVALQSARPRWEDDAYCARIIISSLIGKDWGEETGWGIMAGHPDAEFFEEEYDPVTIEVGKKLVFVDGVAYTFEELVALDHSEMMKCIVGDCQDQIPKDVWVEESGFCVEHSHAYYNQELDHVTLERIEN